MSFRVLISFLIKKGVGGHGGKVAAKAFSGVALGAENAWYLGKFIKYKMRQRRASEDPPSDDEHHEDSRSPPLPTRDQALSMLMASMRAPLDKLTHTVAAIRDQKEAA